MGLPGSGKTTLANELGPMLNAKRLNADEVRKEANDWDFSEEGRKRQAKRMADFAVKLKNDGNYVVADFICPTPEARSLFPADFIIWVDTIKEGRFDDTNKMFVILGTNIILKRPSNSGLSLSSIFFFTVSKSNGLSSTPCTSLICIQTCPVFLIISLNKV